MQHFWLPLYLPNNTAQKLFNLKWFNQYGGNFSTTVNPDQIRFDHGARALDVNDFRGTKIKQVRKKNFLLILKTYRKSEKNIIYRLLERICCPLGPRQASDKQYNVSGKNWACFWAYFDRSQQRRRPKVRIRTALFLSRPFGGRVTQIVTNEALN